MTLSGLSSSAQIIFSGDPSFSPEKLANEAKQLDLPFVLPQTVAALNQQHQAKNTVDYILYRSQSGLELRPNYGKMSPISVDFLAGKNHHRRLYGGGKGQALAKAIGLKKYVEPYVLDATAGLGRDAFILAYLGCHVTLLERSNIVHALLKDGLQRALNENHNDTTLYMIISRMHLLHMDSHSYLKKASKIHRKYKPDKKEYIKQPDIIYLDPMFPPRLKSAQVKKEMLLFHTLVGKDEDSENLLTLACQCAKYRIVVKRPAKAAHLDLRKPHYSLKGKSTRYDIYLPDPH